MDINQTLANGDTIIFGTQCNLDTGGGIWQYTTAVNPTTSQWNDSTATCTRAQWTLNAWHHVVINYHRVSGIVTYDSVIFDNATQAMGNSGNSEFTIGFVPLGNIVVNFQLDGNGSGGTTGYLDETNINRY